MAKKEKKKEEPPVDGGGEGEDAPKKKGLPIMMIAIAGGAVLLLGGGGAGAYFMFLAPKPAADAAAAGEHGEAAADGHGEKAEKKDAKKKDDKGGHGKGDKVDPKTQPVMAEGPDGTTFVTLPDTIANIQSADGRSSYLKLKLTFECADEHAVHALQENLPRINDILQGFIRELRPEDLKGSAGNQQLRLEIMRRINLVLAPSKINAVLIEQMLIT